MPTVLDCLNSAASKLGIKGSGKVLSAEDLQTMMDAANMFIDSLGAERQASWTVKPYVYPLNVGQRIYPIGPTAPAPWTQPRPTEIQSWGVIFPGGSTPLEWTRRKVLTADDYNAGVVLKQLPNAFPLDIYYDYAGDTTSPNGNVFVYPVTNAGGYQLTLYIPETIAPFTDLKQQIFGNTPAGAAGPSYPPGYYQMLVYNIAVIAAPDFGRTIPPEVATIAIRSLSKLKSKNVYVPSMRIQIGGRGVYDPYSDESLPTGRR